MRSTSHFLVLLAVLSWSVVSGQTSADWWYFGAKAGVHFESNGPVSVLNGQLTTLEGCASVSDPLGNLLMYTDGDTVWNKNHQPMPNGFGLLGDPSSTQAAIIVPLPQNPDIYYVFTMHELDAVGLHYSVVDLNLDGGLGDIDTNQKNILVRINYKEKLMAVQHGNGEDFWIVVVPVISDSVQSYALTASGFNMVPVNSTTGDLQSNSSGYLKASPDGDLLVAAHENSILQLMQYDNMTGIASNSIRWPVLGLNSQYGVEFSPDGNLLYSGPRLGFFGDLLQHDISVLDSATISASQIIIESDYGTGGMQLGPNDKIYIANPDQNNTFLGCIEFPNTPGLGCNFVDSAVSLGGRMSNQGLPPFVNTFNQSALTISDLCQSGPVMFTVDTLNYDSIAWDFGNPASGIANLDTGFTVSHTFTDTGNFTITFITFRDSVSDTNAVSVQLLPSPSFSLGQDTTLCFGDSLLLDINQSQATYLWSDGSTDGTFLVTADTTISVTVFGFCDTASDTITVNYSQAFAFNLIDSLSLCMGDTAELDPEVLVDSVSYLWNTPSGTSTNDSIFVIQSGTYFVTATNGCTEVRDTVEALFIPLPIASLPDDTTLCQPDIIVLTRPDNDSITYTWSDSSSTLNFRVDSTSVVWLAAENDCGFSVDTFRLIDLGGFQLSLGPDTQVCPDDTILLNMRYPGADYLWSTGQTSDTIWTNAIDDQYSVTVTLDSCAVVDRINLQFTDVVCESIDCRVDFNNVFTPNGDGWNDNFRLTSDCEIVQFDLRIYSRWGQLVHQSSQSLFGWDGFIAGEPAPEGVYFFVLEFRDEVIVDVDRQSFQGSVTLLR